MSRSNEIVLPESKVLHLDGQLGPFRVLVAYPAQSPPENGWPVIWLLDPADAFMGTVEALRFGARRTDSTGVSSAVVIGVEPDSNNLQAREVRQRIFTEIDSARFADFLHNDVQNAVAEISETRCDFTRSILVGHSLGGVFALRAALANPGRYQAVAAVSPSLWHESADLSELTTTYPADANLKVYIGVGEYEQGLAPWEENLPTSATTLKRRTTRRMVDIARETAAALASGTTAPLASGNVTGFPAPGAQVSNISVEFELLQKADHASARSKALPAILRLTTRQ